MIPWLLLNVHLVGESCDAEGSVLRARPNMDWRGPLSIILNPMGKYPRVGAQLNASICDITGK